MSANPAAVSAANAKVNKFPNTTPANGANGHSDNSNSKGNGNGRKDLGAIIREQLISLKTKLKLPETTPLDQVLPQLMSSFNELEKEKKALTESSKNLDLAKDQKAKEEFSTALANAKNENVELRADLAKANSRNDELSELYTSLQTQLEETRGIFAESQKLVSGNDESSKALKNDLQKTNERVLQLTMELEASQQKSNQNEASFRNSQVELNANKQHFEEQLAAKQAAITTQKAEISNLEAQLNMAREAQRELENSKNQKIAELERLKEEEANGLRTDHNKVKETLLASHKLEKENIHSRLTSDHESKIRQLKEDRDGIVAGLNSQIDILKADVLAKRKTVDNLNGDLEQSKSSIKQMQNQLTSAEQQQRKDKDELSKARSFAAKSLKKNAEDLQAQAKLAKEKEELRKQLLDKLIEHQKQLLALTNSTQALAANANANANAKANAISANAAQASATSPMMFSPVSQVVSSAKIINGQGQSAANTQPASLSLAASVSSLSSQDSAVAEFVDANADPNSNDNAANQSTIAKSHQSK